MKHLQRPTQIQLPERYRVHNGKQFKSLDKVWKQILREIKEDGTHRMYAPLSILRNLMLGRDMYTGFTPHLHPNNLKNGRGFIDGFSVALRQLSIASAGTRINHLSSAYTRMILSVHPWPSVGELEKKNVFPPESTFWCVPYADGYIARVQKMIIRLQDSGQYMQGKTYSELFDMFDSTEQYNLIHPDDWDRIKESGGELQQLLFKFSQEWMQLEPKMKDSRLQSAKIVEDYPNWMYTDTDGIDHRIQKKSGDQIEITTVPKYSSNRIDGKYYLPVSYLWETDWLKEYTK